MPFLVMRLGTTTSPARTPAACAASFSGLMTSCCATVCLLRRRDVVWVVDQMRRFARGPYLATDSSTSFGSPASGCSVGSRPPEMGPVDLAGAGLGSASANALASASSSSAVSPWSRPAKLRGSPAASAASRRAFSRSYAAMVSRSSLVIASTSSGVLAPSYLASVSRSLVRYDAASSRSCLTYASSKTFGLGWSSVPPSAPGVGAPSPPSAPPSAPAPPPPAGSPSVSNDRPMRWLGRVGLVRCSAVLLNTSRLLGESVRTCERPATGTGLGEAGLGSALLGSDVLAPRGQGVFAGPACRHAGPLPRIPAVQGEERGVAELVSRVDGLGVAVAVVVVLVDVRSLAGHQLLSGRASRPLRGVQAALRREATRQQHRAPATGRPRAGQAHVAEHSLVAVAGRLEEVPSAVAGDAGHCGGLAVASFLVGLVAPCIDVAGRLLVVE